MGQGELLGARAAALMLLAAAAAQGPLYRDRWADLQIETLRARVLTESRARDDATMAAVADLLAGPDEGVAARPAALALARLRGVAADDAFVLRAAIGAYVLPEVVDPEAKTEECRALHVTVLLPSGVALPGALTFALEVWDKAGERRHRVEFGQGAPIDDVRMGHVSASVPAELADGTYRLRLLTQIDGAPPRDQDLFVEHAFHVLRGYQARAESVQQRAPLASAKLGPVPAAVLEGMVLEVNRAYTGEAFDGVSDAVADLLAVEGALERVRNGEDPLAGQTGTFAIGLPTGGSEVLSAVIRRPAASSGPKRPLLVVIPGAPALDVTGRRPSAPATRSARWLRHRVCDFGLVDQPLAWLRSPGGGQPFAKALPAALAALHTLLETDGRTVFVLELDAAVALVYAPEVLALASGAVLVGAGALPPPTLQRLPAMPILGVPLSGHPSAQGLTWTAERLKDGAVTWAGSFRLAPPRPRPWVFGAAAARDEIGAFVRALPPADAGK